MADIILSRIHPDYAQIRAQFQLALSALDSWKDLLPTATGQALTDFVSGVADLDQYGIEKAFGEAFLSARRDSSIYAIARMLGVRLARKTPASAGATLTRQVTTGTLAIPAYTQFVVNGLQMFCREPLVFNVGVGSITCVLYEGQVKNVSVLADGSDFQMFVASEKGFTVADSDIKVTAGGNPIEVNTRGLWNQKSGSGVQDVTYASGELVLLFGNADYGYKPGVNTLLNISYVVTQGTAGNDSTLSGSKVNTSGYPEISGVLTTAVSGGGDQRKAGFYRRFGPQLYSANSKATLEDEYTAMAASYPSVVDALVVGQRKLSLSDNAYMNLVRVSLLTTSTWGTPQIEDFKQWFQARTMFPTRFYLQNPLPRPVNISANVYCRREANLTEVETAVRQNLGALLEAREGIIGMNVYKHDIHTAIEKASPALIEFVELLAPTTDVFPMFRPPKPPKVTALAGLGTLAAGVVSYAIAVITTDGETLASNIGTQTVAAGDAARIDWDPVPGGLGFKLYGREFPDAHLMATLPPTTLTFTDTGAALTGAPPPATDTSGIRYCTQGTVVLNMYYTDRRLT